MPKVRVARNAGFCYGVDRAVKTVLDLLDAGEKVATCGPIIHNTQIVDELSRRGVKVVSSPGECEPGRVLVIRSHGVPLAVVEEARRLRVRLSDATCPFVARIHNIVAAASAAGETVLVAGDASHSEVVGITGHCSGGRYVVVRDAEELEEMTRAGGISPSDPLCAVAQTTFRTAEWEKIKNFLKKVYTNAKIFDTICNATEKRQEEAAALSRECDAMVVVGGKHSSNTGKLYGICLAGCERTVRVETAAELRPEVFYGAETVGVVAGASTPAGIIKEVVLIMSELENQANENIEEVAGTAVTPEAGVKAEQKAAVSPAPVDAGRVDAAGEPESAGEPVAAEASVGEAAVEAPAEEAPAEVAPTVPTESELEAMPFGEALQAYEAGSETTGSEKRVKGIVISVNPTEIQVDIGRKQTGYVSAEEYSYDPSAKMTEEVHVGDELDLLIMRVNDQEGTVSLSKRRADSIVGWEKVNAAFESGEVLTSTINEIVKGGVVTSYKGVRVFIPASHATLTRGEPIDGLKGKEVEYKIIEIGRGKRVIGSIREVLLARRKEKEAAFWETAAVGDRFTGKVKSLTGYGAFVDIGGVDGMVHISELSWQRIKNPSEVVSVGDVIDVYIKGLDRENKKVSLGYKKPEDNPWLVFENNYAVGDVVPVKIVSMTSYGAFARIIPGVDGLIHISKIADRRIEKPQDELKIGQEVKVKIIDIDREKKRISLSIRDLLEAGEDVTVYHDEEPAPESVEEPAGETVETSVPEAVSEGAGAALGTAEPAPEAAAEKAAPVTESAAE